MAKVLIVGKDGVVGEFLGQWLVDYGLEVVFTSRRSESSSDSRFLDLKEPKLSDFGDVDVVIMLAGLHNYQLCDSNVDTDVTNCFDIPKFLEYFLRSGKHVVFVSTNSIFGGNLYRPSESCSPSPAIGYARQKFTTENILKGVASRLDAQNLLSIIRLTKIVTSATSPFDSWIDRASAGEILEPFGDLIFSPVCLPYVADQIGRVIEHRYPGIIHLSGRYDLSYANFCRDFVSLVRSPSPVYPTSSVAKGVEIPFLPKYSGLSQTRGSEIGLRYCELEEVLEVLSVEVS